MINIIDLIDIMIDIIDININIFDLAGIIIDIIDALYAIQFTGNDNWHDLLFMMAIGRQPVMHMLQYPIGIVLVPLILSQ